MSERYYNSTGSKSFKYGNNPVHELAKEVVKKVLINNKFETLENSEAQLLVNWFLSDEYKKRFFTKGSYIHNYDIFAQKLVGKKLYIELFIEIDGKKLHDKPHQARRDRIAERFAEFFFPDSYFIRIEKREVIGNYNKEVFNKEEDLRNFINKKIKNKYNIRKDIV
ncbi:MAG: hypothetical protein R3321_01295 [Nitrososphaeraceae archaeon]|nr:hypothetical protein [Nitrososphaeraceae archaeon]